MERLACRRHDLSLIPFTATDNNAELASIATALHGVVQMTEPLASERSLKVRQGKHLATSSLVLQTPKVPEVTLAFWVIKVAATTLGETGGDALSMTMNLGYALSSIVFFTLFLVAVAVQLASKSFHPFLYWLVIVATTTAGTTMADFADRSLGIGYFGGSPGDLLTKPSAHGGLNLDRISSTLVIAIFIAGCILFTSQRAVHHVGERLQ